MSKAEIAYQLTLQSLSRLKGRDFEDRVLSESSSATQFIIDIFNKIYSSILLDDDMGK